MCEIKMDAEGGAPYTAQSRAKAAAGLKQMRGYAIIKGNLMNFGKAIKIPAAGRRLALRVQESGENYLETILILKDQNGSVRSVDIARSLSFTKPSISRAMSILKNAGLITIDGDGLIELTGTGLQRAKNVYDRHRMLSDFLQSIGVNEKTAAEDACRMEHVISEETFIKMKEHMIQIPGENNQNNKLSETDN